jgi:integrase
MTPRKFHFSETALQRLLREAARWPSNHRVEYQDLNPTGLWARAYGPSSHHRGKPRVLFNVPYRFSGRQQRLTLQPAYPDLDYAAASMQAHEAYIQWSTGVDPATVRRKQKQQIGQAARRDPVETVVADFVQRYLKQAGPRPKAPAYIRSTERLLERFAVKEWGGRDVRTITKRDVIALTDKVVDAGHGTTANRLYQALSKLFVWCVERDLLTTSPMLGTKKPSAEIERERSLSPVELRVVWLAAQQLPYPYRQYFNMLIATGQRRSEVAKMKWADLSDDGWLIPAPDTKTKKHPHLVPTSMMMTAILDDECQAKQDGRFVFPGRYGTGINNFHAMKQQLDAAVLEFCAETGETVPEAFTIHDLRRTFATLLGPLKVTRFVVSRLLNHADGSVTGKHYDRYEYKGEKAEALQTWADYLACLMADDPDRVTAFPGR